MSGLRYGLAGAAALGFVSLATVASAQSYVVREYNSVVIDDAYDDDAIEIYQDDAPEVVEVAPAEPLVYGWVAARPYPNCGTMRYWDGASCLDARFEPPYPY